MKRLTSVLLCVLLCLPVLPIPAGAGELMPYDAAVYAGKTRAGILGHVAGLLSGFEFIWQDGEPLAPLPEAWFRLMGGPYGNGPAHGGAGVGRFLENGIGSDDDYHIDFFNQWILREKGTDPSHKDLYDAWRAYQVSDWGGGDKAMSIMRKQKLPPPYTGLFEYGNIFHWCTEPYIENETLGLIAPGMPQTAWRLADRFASITGDFESLDWGRFWASAYALAYVEPDIRAVLEASVPALLPGSWPWRIYEECVALYDGGTPWAEAVVAIHQKRRGIHQTDNIQCAADVNNGFALLALLYGDGDFLESVKLASISGYDADCTAATVGGLLGITGGMEGLPQEVLTVIWQEGQGVYVNDRLFVPHIGGDYPGEQTFGEIADLYIENGHAQILAHGGRVEEDTLYLPLEHPPAWQGFQPEWGDFEGEDLLGWQTAGEAAFFLERGEKAHSGDACGAVRLTPEAERASLMLPVTGLTPGGWYRLSAYVMTSFDGEARLTLEQGEEALYASAQNVNKGWVLREVLFQARGETARVGLVAAQQPGDGGITAYLDDVRLERLEDLDPVSVPLEPLDLAGREPYDLTITVERAGDYALRLSYSHTGTSMVQAEVALDGEMIFSTAFPPTSLVHTRCENAAVLPLRLTPGEHHLTLTPLQDGVRLYGTIHTVWPRAALSPLGR